MRQFNHFYVYGGRDETHIFSDIHQYTIGTNSWRPVVAKAVAPNSNEHKTYLRQNQIPSYLDLLSEPKIRFGHSAVIN